MRKTLLLLFSVIIPSACLLAADGVIRRLVWQIETSDPIARNWPVTYGETFDMEVRFMDHMKPMDLTGGSVVLHCRTNGMETGYSFQQPGTLMAAQGWATVRVAVNTLLPAGLTEASYVVAVTQGGTTNLLAAQGTFRLTGISAGINGSPLPSSEIAALSARVTAASNAISAIAAIPPADFTRWLSADRTSWLSSQGGTINEYSVTSTNRWYVQCEGTPVTNGTFEVFNAPALFTTNGIWKVNAPGIWGASNLTNSSIAVSVSIAVPWNNYYATQLPQGRTSYRLYTGAGAQGTVTLYRVSSMLTNSLSYFLPQRTIPTNAVPGWLLYDYGSNDWISVVVSNRSFTLWKVTP